MNPAVILTLISDLVQSNMRLNKELEDARAAIKQYQQGSSASSSNDSVVDLDRTADG